MKFIRDIINEKKQAGLTETPEPQMTAMRPAPEPVMVEPLVDDVDEVFNLFEDDAEIEGTLVSEGEVLFDAPVAEQPAPVDTLDLGGYESQAMPQPQEEAQPAPVDLMAPEMPSDDALTQHILTRRAVTKIPETVANEAAPAPAEAIEVPAPSAGRASRRAGRVKTRLLGFGSAEESVSDPFAAAPATPPQARPDLYPVGWIVVTDGPGAGTAFTLFDGVSQIGRGEDQAIRLDFGDTSISRSNHAAIAYDAEQKSFFLGHGGKANLVRMNGRPVLSTEPLNSGDQIRIGETSLRFVGLCGPDFDWTASRDEGEPRVSYA